MIGKREEKLMPRQSLETISTGPRHSIRARPDNGAKARRERGAPIADSNRPAIPFRRLDGKVYLVRNNSSFSVSSRRDIVAAIRRLRHARETADYRPGETIERSDAVRFIRDAMFVLEATGIT